MDFPNRHLEQENEKALDGTDTGIDGLSLHCFRMLWFASLFAGGMLLAVAIWIEWTSAPRSGADMAPIVILFAAFLICALGAIPYGVAQLIASDDKKGRDDFGD